MESNPYITKEYNSRARWVTYYGQWRTLLEALPTSARILEIGVGAGVARDQLKRLGYNVTTLDQDERVRPDVVGDMRTLPFSDGEFDAVLAAEILEHVPFEDAEQSLREMSRVSKGIVCISVPDRRPILFSCKIKIPFFKERKILIKIPIAKQTLSSKEHQWEIGYKSYTLGRVRAMFERAGLAIQKDFILFDAPQIHFFLLGRFLTKENKK